MESKPRQAELLGLPREILLVILGHIAPDPDKPVLIHRRQFLSVESFDRPPPSTCGSIKDLGNFRSVCKDFADAGAPFQYARVETRFSIREFDRLDQLAKWPKLANHVKKFTYLIPYFYHSHTQEKRITLPGLRDARLTFDISHLQREAAEQRQIVESGRDLKALKNAISKFTTLQSVQLLRRIDAKDVELLRYIEQYGDTRRLFELDWPEACVHGSRTIGAALLESNVSWSRFSSPMASPQIAELLAAQNPRSVSSLAERLTCLTLHFDDGHDLDQRISEMSELFKKVFTAAKNMEAVHIGFPSSHPLNLPLESVFHHVKWDKLVAFGIQGWKLNTAEISDLALRYKHRLRGLRLRDILLKEGSMWKDVLLELRENMPDLEWVSLRRIGYVKNFDERRLIAGAEVPDEPPPGDSDSSEPEEDEHDPIAGPSNGSAAVDDTYSVEDSDEGEHMEGNSEDEPESDDEHGAAANEMGFPPFTSALPQASALICNCDGRPHRDGAEDLGDDGYIVSTAQRRAWEKWVVHRCPEHGKLNNASAPSTV